MDSVGYVFRHLYMGIRKGIGQLRAVHAHAENKRQWSRLWISVFYDARLCSYVTISAALGS